MRFRTIHSRSSSHHSCAFSELSIRFSIPILRSRKNSEKMDKLFVEVHGKNGAWYTVMSQHLRPMDPTRPAKVKLQPKTTHCEHISELKELKCSAVTRGKDGEERKRKKAEKEH